MTAGVRKVQSSLALQILLYFGGWYDLVFWVINIAVFVYKGMNLPYPKDNFDIEFSLSFLYVLIDPVRLFLGSKGNKTEQPAPLSFSILLALPLVAYYVYCMLYQTYVLSIDQVLHGTALALCGLQILLSIVAIISFARAGRST